MRAANDQASLCISAVSPEPSLIALKRRDVDESSGQNVYTSSCDLGTYRICEQQMIRRACTLCTVSPEPLLIALKRRDVDEGSGQIVYASSFDLRFYCPPPFRRKAEGHSFRHSVLPFFRPSFRPSVPLI